LQYLVWKHEGDAFLKTFERFLAAAEKNGMTVLPIFFDDCAFSGREPYPGRQDEPNPGVHNSGWTASPGFSIADDPSSEKSLKAYVQNIVEKYKNDGRITAWDLYNEPGNSGREHKSLPLLKKTFDWARECGPSQPLTSGIWAWKKFDFACAELSDIISFHDYGNIEDTKKHLDELKKYKRPLFCTEWLHRPNGSAIASHLPLFKAEKIAAYNWGLVNGKTQTHLNWDASKNKGNETAIWQHDIFTKDLKPYSAEEIGLLKKLSGKGA
jgi:hypothetical protein